MTQRTYCLLGLFILLAAAGLRFTQLASLPPGPHYDEAANLLITRSVAYGGALPFPMVENYQGREVLYYYLSTPLLWTVQNSRFALQLTSAFSGMLLVALTMSLSRAMVATPRGRTVAIAAGIVAAISIPQIILSRQAFRAVTLPMMQALSLWLLWRGLNPRSRRGWAMLVLGGAVAGLTVYTYNSSRLFPVWLAVGGLVLLIADAGERQRRLRQGLAFFLPLIVLALPFAWYAVQRPDVFFGRFYEVTGGTDEITLTESIWRHIKMFIWQGETLLRYNPPGRPYFTLPAALLLLIGLGVSARQLVRGRSNALQRAGAVLLLLAPFMVLPSVIATSGLPPNHMRSTAMAPLIFIVVGVGAARLLAFLQLKRLRNVLLVVALSAGTLNAARVYFNWASRADLYYDTDADLAAAAQWLNQRTPDADVVYIAARDRFHPTVQVFQTPPVRWLGTDTLFLPPAGNERLVVFPRSAPPPEDWQTWLSSAQVEDVPLAPDGQPAFLAFRLPAEMPLPPDVNPVESQLSNGPLTLAGRSTVTAFPNGTLVSVSAWQVEQTPVVSDLTPIVHMEDTLGNVIIRAESFSTGTDTWQPGETLIQRVPGLRVPVGTPPGRYPLRLTWVARSTNTYLPYRQGDAGAGLWADVGAVEVIVANRFPSPDDVPVTVENPVDVAQGVRLLGWEPLPASVRPGATLPLTWHWHAPPAASRTDVTYDVLLDGRPLPLAAPLLAEQPTSEWVDDQLMTERLQASVPPDVPAGNYTLSLRFGEQTVFVGTLTVEGIPRLFEPPSVAEQTDIVYGDSIALYGYTLERADAGLNVSLVWQSVQPVSTDYTVFVHILDADGNIIAQQDAMPKDNTYPTSLWQPGEFVVDTYTLDVTDRAHQIRLGLYQQSNGTRLEHTDNADSYTFSIKKNMIN